MHLSESVLGTVELSSSSDEENSYLLLTKRKLEEEGGEQDGEGRDGGRRG